MIRVVLFSLLFTSTPCYALLFDLNAFYFSDGLDSGTENTNNRMFLEFSGAIDLSKKGQIILGWAYTMLTYKAEGTATLEASTADTGPKIGWFLDKQRTWSACFTYNLFANTTFDDGSGEVRWRGKSYKADFGESLALGMRINYYSASYSEQFDASDTFSQISNSQGAIFPSLSMTYFLN